MPKNATPAQLPEGMASDTAEFYRSVLEILSASGTPFLMGGAFAFGHYVGHFRDTKDLDIFCLPGDYTKLLDTLQQAGYTAELTDANWLAKARHGERFVDLIFNSRNGICPVDETWLQHARTCTFLDVEVKLIPVEEMIWQKVYVSDRFRYDGADVCHLILKQGQSIDWHRLLGRLDRDWELLFTDLMLFRYVYPADRALVPQWLLEEMMSRLSLQFDLPEPQDRVCRGGFLSKSQYQIDYDGWGYSEK